MPEVARLFLHVGRCGDGHNMVELVRVVRRAGRRVVIDPLSAQPAHRLVPRPHVGVESAPLLEEVPTQLPHPPRVHPGHDPTPVP